MIRIYHNPINADEILLLIRDHEGDTHNSIPLEKFQRWDAKRIEQEISYLYCQPSRKYLPHIPSVPYERDVLKTKTRLVVIHPLPKGCEEYEPFWCTIPELDIVSCNSVKEGLRLIQECRPDAVVFHPSTAKKGEAFLRELRDVLHVSTRCMPHVFFLCRDGQRYYIQQEGGHLLRAAKLPSAAWFAKYALLDLHIQEGCFSFTTPLSLKEMKAGIQKGLIKHRIHAELEDPFEAAAVYALTFFQHMELVDDAFEAAVKELGWEQSAFWAECYSGRREYCSARQAASYALQGMWAAPYTIRKSTVPCSPIAKALADTEWHKHLRFSGSPVQIGGEACENE